MLIVLTSCGNNSRTSGLYDSREAAASDVWVCMGTSSHAFHASYSCKGMKSCKGEKKKMSLNEAYSIGRTPCHFCCDEHIYKDPHDPDTFDPKNYE